jgi:hypothetical protein
MTLALAGSEMGGMLSEIPEFVPRMPTDPEIQRQKTREEQLWEAAYDGNVEAAEAIDKNDVDLDWHARVRLGFFTPPNPAQLGWTPFHVACCYNRTPKFVAMLLAAGCDADACNKSGQTGWDLAKQHGQVRTALSLVTVVIRYSYGLLIKQHGQNKILRFLDTEASSQIDVAEDLPVATGGEVTFMPPGSFAILHTKQTGAMRMPLPARG